MLYTKSCCCHPNISKCLKYIKRKQVLHQVRMTESFTASAKQTSRKKRLDVLAGINAVGGNMATEMKLNLCEESHKICCYRCGFKRLNILKLW